MWYRPTRKVLRLSKPSTELLQLVCRCVVRAKQRTFRTLFLPHHRTPRETPAVVEHNNLAKCFAGSCSIFDAKPVAVLQIVPSAEFSSKNSVLACEHAKGGTVEVASQRGIYSSSKDN